MDNINTNYNDFESSSMEEDSLNITNEWNEGGGSGDRSGHESEGCSGCKGDESGRWSKGGESDRESQGAESILKGDNIIKLNDEEDNIINKEKLTYEKWFNCSLSSLLDGRLLVKILDSKYEKEDNHWEFIYKTILTIIQQKYIITNEAAKKIVIQKFKFFEKNELNEDELLELLPLFLFAVVSSQNAKNQLNILPNETKHTLLNVIENVSEYFSSSIGLEDYALNNNEDSESDEKDKQQEYMEKDIINEKLRTYELEISKLRETNDDFTNLVETYYQENKELCIRLRTLEDELKNEKEKFFENNMSNSQLQSSTVCYELLNDHLRNKVIEKEKEIGRLRGQIQNYVSQLNSNETIKAELIRMRESSQLVPSLKQQILSLQTQLASKNQLIQKFQIIESDHTELVKKTAFLENALAEYEKKYFNIQQNFQKEVEKNSCNRSNIVDSNLRETDISIELEIEKEKNNRLEVQISEMASQNAEQEKKYHQLLEENISKMKQDVEKLTGDMEKNLDVQLKQKILQLEEENIKLKQFGSIETIALRHQLQLEKSKSEIYVRSWDEKEKSFIETIKEYKKRDSELTEKNNFLKIELEHLRKAKDNADESMKSIYSEQSQLKDKLEVNLSKEQRLNEQLKKAYEETKKKLTSIEEKELKTRNETLEKAKIIIELQNVLDSERLDKEKLKKSVTECAEHQKAEIRRLTSKVNELEKIQKDYAKEKEEMSEALKKKMNDLEEQKKDKQFISLQIHQLSAENKKLLDENTELKETYTIEKLEMIQKHEKTIEELKKIHEEKMIKLEVDGMKKISEIRKNHDLASSKKLTAELEKAQESTQKLSKENTDLKENIRIIESKLEQIDRNSSKKIEESIAIEKKKLDILYTQKVVDFENMTKENSIELQQKLDRVRQREIEFKDWEQKEKAMKEEIEEKELEILIVANALRQFSAHFTQNKIDSADSENIDLNYPIQFPSQVPQTPLGTGKPFRQLNTPATKQSLQVPNTPSNLGTPLSTSIPFTYNVPITPLAQTKDQKKISLASRKRLTLAERALCDRPAPDLKKKREK